MGKPTFWQRNAYLTVPERLTTQSYPKLPKVSEGSTARGSMEAEAQTEVEEIHLGSATDSHGLRGLFQVAQMWPDIKRLRGALMPVPKTHSGEGGQTCWQMVLTFGGAMGRRQGVSGRA